MCQVNAEISSEGQKEKKKRGEESSCDVQLIAHLMVFTARMMIITSEWVILPVRSNPNCAPANTTATFSIRRGGGRWERVLDYLVKRKKKYLKIFFFLFDHTAVREGHQPHLCG